MTPEEIDIMFREMDRVAEDPLYIEVDKVVKVLIEKAGDKWLFLVHLLIVGGLSLVLQEYGEQGAITLLQGWERRVPRMQEMLAALGYLGNA